MEVMVDEVDMGVMEDVAMEDTEEEIATITTTITMVNLLIIR